MKATKFSQYLESREHLKFIDTPHWIYVVEALIWSVIIVAAGVFLKSFIADNVIYPRLHEDITVDGFVINIAAYAAHFVLWGAVIWATIFFLIRLAFFVSTYVFASDRRLYMKTGLIFVLVNEVSFDEVRKTDISYGVLGRFLGYGKLLMDARFVSDMPLPYIYSPEKFTKLIHYSNDLEDDINLSFATNGMRERENQAIPAKSQQYKEIDTLQDQAELSEKQMSKHPQERIPTEDIMHSDFDGVAVASNEKTLHKPAEPSSRVTKVGV